MLPRITAALPPLTDTSLEVYIPKRLHDQLVLRVSLLENHHLHRIDGWRYFNPSFFGLGHRVGAGLSAPDSLHEYGAPRREEPGNLDAPPAANQKHVCSYKDLAGKCTRKLDVLRCLTFERI